jgi:hypothetical protein
MAAFTQASLNRPKINIGIAMMIAPTMMKATTIRFLKVATL